MRFNVGLEQHDWEGDPLLLIICPPSPPRDFPHHACQVISTEHWKPGTLGKFRNLCGPLLSVSSAKWEAVTSLGGRGRERSDMCKPPSVAVSGQADPPPPGWSTQSWVCLGAVLSAG